METDASFVRADGIVELHAVADIVLNFAFVVDPCHAECDNAVGFDHAFDYLVTFEFRMLVIHVLNREKNFLHSLKVFFFARMLGFQVGHDMVNIHNLMFLCA